MASFDQDSADQLVQILLNNPQRVHDLNHPLPEELSQAICEKLKKRAEDNAYKDRKLALALAECIITIAEKRNDLKQVALGNLAYGNALWQLGDLSSAWEKFALAGNNFLNAGHEHGWARTRISRLYLSVNLKAVQEAIEDAYQAECIFVAYNDHDMLLRLYLNWGAALNFKGDYHPALHKFQQALDSADKLDNRGGKYRGMIYLNQGYSFKHLSEFRTALAHYKQAKDFFEKAETTTGVIIAENNIAQIEILQGHYRRALSRLVRVEHQMTDEQKNEHAHVFRVMIDCYLALDDYEQARNLAQELITRYGENKADFQKAKVLLYLAIAQAELGNYEEAQVNLDDASDIYKALESDVWLATVNLRRAQISLKQGNTAQALEAIDALIPELTANHQQIESIEAILLRAQALFERQALEEANACALDALRLAVQHNNPAMRYNALLLLGQLANQCDNPQRAMRRYAAANRISAGIQRRLTITMQSSFLANKNKALHYLIQSQLDLGKIRPAFETLERAKSQIWQEYILNREHLRWNTEDEQSQELIAELNQLREDYHWYYRAASGKYDEQPESVKINVEHAIRELHQCERRIRAITQALYLHTGQDTQRDAVAGSSEGIQQSINDEGVLIEYYNNGQSLFAFVITSHSFEMCKLSTTPKEIDRLQKNLYLNINRALGVGPTAPAIRTLTHQFNNISHKLYQKLLAPLPEQVKKTSRLIIVPYGSLHYVPFHLLRDAVDYCIGTKEVVILPSAGMLGQQSRESTGKPMILAHSHSGKLSHVINEANQIGYLFNSPVYYEEDAIRDQLLKKPTQILHIATHGEFRIDQPEFSHILLDDGQLFADDLMQFDLSYQLVTVSACETWRAQVTPGDELVGLGRSLLYAGAESLIASLWRVEDSRTATLMQNLYSQLMAGASRAQSVMTAQNMLREAEPDLHPAYWGAFELIGQASPLSPS